MHITTFDKEDTDRLVSLAKSKIAIEEILHILANKHNPSSQIKAVRKLLGES